MRTLAILAAVAIAAAVGAAPASAAGSSPCPRILIVDEYGRDVSPCPRPRLTSAGEIVALVCAELERRELWGASS